MPSKETGSSASLLDMQTLCSEDGPSLSLVSHVRRVEELQTFPAVPDLHICFLLVVFRPYGALAMG